MSRHAVTLASQGTDLPRRTYCQIVAKKIAANVCDSTQGQEACFGCASVLRRCEICKTQRVDVPAVGMCSWCLAEALEDKKHVVKPNLKFGSKVHCQVLKRPISVPMCNATQGQPECAGCRAPSRLCEKCQQRRAKYPRYGLCLVCTVEDYGEGWQPKPADQRPKSKATVVPDPASGVIRIVVQRTDQHAGSPDPTPVSNPKEVQEMMPQSRSGDQAQSAEPTWEPPPESIRRTRAGDRKERAFERLVTEARELVIRTRRASAVYLARELHIDQGKKAPAVLMELQRRGVIGPPRGTKKVREVLVSMAPKAPDPETPRSATCIHRNPDGRICGESVWIKRLSLCVTHGHAFYRHQKRAQARETQPGVDPMAMTLLRAKQFILSERRATGRSLARHLKVDFQAAKRVINRLRQEGFLGKHLSRRRGWEILGTSVTNTSTTALVPWSSQRVLQGQIAKVEEFIRLIGEKSEMAVALRALIDEVRRLEDVRKVLEH